jgi:hypothetical protein
MLFVDQDAARSQCLPSRITTWTPRYYLLRTQGPGKVAFRHYCPMALRS